MPGRNEPYQYHDQRGELRSPVRLRPVAEAAVSYPGQLGPRHQMSCTGPVQQQLHTRDWVHCDPAGLQRPLHSGDGTESILKNHGFCNVRT